MLPCDGPGKTRSKGRPEEMVMVELDEFVRKPWSSEILFCISSLSGVSNGSGVSSSFNLVTGDVVVDLLELLPCVVVDIDRTELLAENSGREWSEDVSGSGELFAGGVRGMSPAIESPPSPSS